MTKVALLLALFLLPAHVRCASTFCANNADYKNIELNDGCYCAEVTKDKEICEEVLDGTFSEKGLCFDPNDDNNEFVSNKSEDECSGNGKGWVACVSQCPGTLNNVHITADECAAIGSEHADGYAYRRQTCQDIVGTGLYIGVDLTNPDEDDCDDLESAEMPGMEGSGYGAYAMYLEPRMKACCVGEDLACDVKASPAMNVCSNPTDFESDVPFASGMFGYDDEGYICDGAYHEVDEDCGACDYEDGPNDPFCDCPSEDSCKAQGGTWQKVSCGQFSSYLANIKDPNTPLSEYNEDNCPLDSSDVDSRTADMYFSEVAEVCCGSDYDELGDHICDRDEDWSEELNDDDDDSADDKDKDKDDDDDSSPAMTAMQAVALTIAAMAVL
jgi:hypothetical protein